MTTYNGVLLQNALVLTVTPNPPAGHWFGSSAIDKTSYLLQSGSIVGTKTPVDSGAYPPPVTKAGFVLPSFFDDLYNNAYLSPSGFNVGNLVRESDNTLNIWNGYFTSIQLTSVVISGSGVVITDLPALPKTLKPLEDMSLTLRALMDGPPIIDNSIQFTFSTGETFTVPVDGKRIIAFPYAPNWANPVIESLEWRTDVMRAHDGTEQRRSLRVVPRRSFEYDILLSGKDVSRFETLLWGWQYRQFAMPVWTDRCLTTSQANAGATTIGVATADMSFTQGAMAVLYIDNDNFEIASIISVSGGSITVEAPLEKTWPQGSEIYPALFANLPATIPTQRHTDSAITGRISFTTSPDVTDPNTPTAVAPVVYDGFEVITRQPNWKSAINNDLMHVYDTLSADTGPIMTYARETAGYMIRPYSWVLRDRTQIVDFRKMLARLRGQAKPFWVPSWHNDMTVVDLNLSTLIVEGELFANMVGLDTARDRLLIRLNNGTNLYRRITAVSAVSGNTSLSLDSPVAVGVTEADVHALHLLYLCRMASDKVEIPWRTDRVADPTLNFMTVTA